MNQVQHGRKKSLLKTILIRTYKINLKNNHEEKMFEARNLFSTKKKAFFVKYQTNQII